MRFLRLTLLCLLAVASACGGGRSTKAAGRDGSVDRLTPEAGSTSADAAPALADASAPSAPAQNVDATTVDAAAACVQPEAEAACSAGYCRIEPGCFVIGAPREEFGVGRYSDRQAQVTLTHRFVLGENEVTRAQWLAAGMPMPQRGALAGSADCSDADCPVSNVNFYEALAFANRLSDKEGLAPCFTLSGCSGEVGRDYQCREVTPTSTSLYDCPGYRLPTEAEWEYAARAGTAGAFYSGEIVPRQDFDCYEEPNLESIAWYCSNAGGRAHPVGRKQANAWGLHDMLGNVFEWCMDNLEGEGYGPGPLVDPVVLKKPGTGAAPSEETIRVARGGNHVSAPLAAKVNKRLGLAAFGADSGLGVRVARTLRDP